MEHKRSLKDYLIIFGKGIGMGAADVVPGVSGGTIAFIAGIYEELIESISRINLHAFQKLFKEGFFSFWAYVNGNFFVALLGGIAIAILSLAKIITHLLDTEPVLIWSFFFGLVFTSIYYVGKNVKTWNLHSYVSFVFGCVIAFGITSLPALGENDALWYLFISGMIAICAMILPGISGSFILLLLGSYSTVLTAVHDFNLAVVFVFATGAVIGLLSFTRFLKWLFQKYHDLTIALLSGFLLGSLNKIWPWKHTISSFIKNAGEPNEKVIPVEQVNVLPENYEMLTNMPAQTLWAVVLFLVGASIIVILETLGGSKSRKA